MMWKLFTKKVRKLIQSKNEGTDENLYIKYPGICAAFLSGEKVENKIYNDFIYADDWTIEYLHTYIQYAFPLKEASNFNPTAPILTDDEIHWIRTPAGDTARNNLMLMFNRMLAFYGFAYTSESQIALADDFEKRRDAWLTYGNHNMLRITRILKSLMLLGYETEAKKFFTVLKWLYDNDDNACKSIGESFEYWENAVK